MLDSERDMKDACGILPRQRCFVHAGKFGDEMILLGGLKHIYDETGIKPVVVVAQEFASIFDGVSYATADPLALSWWQEVDKMCAYAEAKYGHFICPKFWDAKLPPPQPRPGARLTKIQFMGRDIILAEEDWTSYQSAQWVAAGFELHHMLEWPLVFDRRNAVRENELRKQFFKTNRPKLLVAIAGPGTSPFPGVPEVMQVVNKFRNDFEIIDLSRIHATRIYDMLGLYDHAAGLIVNDSAPLHLAGASRVPFVAFINNGGSGSIPRGNCVLQVRYAHVMPARQRLEAILNHWKHAPANSHAIRTERPGSATAVPSGGGNLAFSAMVR